MANTAITATEDFEYAEEEEPAEWNEILADLFDDIADSFQYAADRLRDSLKK